MVNTRILVAWFVAVSLSACNYHDATGFDDVTESEEPVGQQGRKISVRVLDYSPMPGQYVNVAPPYATGDDAAAMALKAEEYMSRGYFVSLGAWGGSITLELDEPVYHRPSGRDFRICGNAFYNNTSHTSPYFGSSEPGIILVSADADNDGQPDEWFEIMGSESDRADGGVTVTYRAPVDDGVRDVEWSADNGDTGVIEANMFHLQPYYPQWVKEAELSYTGRRLPDNGYFSQSLNQYLQTCYDYGYADAHPDRSDASVINLAWAVDSDGNPVELPSIKFVKIYTGILQCNMVTGECSTEVTGVEVPAE